MKLQSRVVGLLALLEGVVGKQVPPLERSGPGATLPRSNDNLRAEWIFPGAIALKQQATVRYRINGMTQGGQQIVLVLGQTDTSHDRNVTSANSRVVVNLFPCKNGKCEGDPSFVEDQDQDSREFQTLDWTFLRDDNSELDPSRFHNFFLCFGTSADKGKSVICQTPTMSKFFSIELADSDLELLSAGENASTGRGDSRGVEQNSDGDSGQRGIASDTSAFGPTNAAGFVQSNPSSALSPTEIPAPPIPPREGTLFLEGGDAFVTYANIPQSYLPVSTTPSIISTSFGATATSTPTAQTSIASGKTNTAPVSASRGGLSTGAKVGIALGVLVLVSLLAAIALFFCLRRRKRAQSGAQKHEQVMLTHAQHENNSQDLLAEKDTAVHTLIHPNSNDSNFSRHDHAQTPNDSTLRQTLIPAGAVVDRHNSTHEPQHNVYRDADGSRDIQLTPFVAPVPSAVPRRKPTNASIAPSAVSALSRNVSSSTTASRPRSPSLDYPHHTLQDIGEETANSNNGAGVARYGETRHTPTFHTTGPGGAVSIVPAGASASAGVGGGAFLSEPGMSPAEVARLEEEERRIDEAIAAADQQRERDRNKGLR